MRILCTSDPHNDMKFISGVLRIIKKEKINVFVCCGDFHSVDYSKKLFNSIDIPCFSTIGNWDYGCYSDNKRICLDYGVAELDGYCFFMVGNNIPFHFEKIAFSDTKEIDSKKMIFITHYPPYGILDRLWSGRHVGYPEFEKFIKLKKPLVNIFGHIHEDTGIIKTKEGTICINCSYPETGTGFVFDTDKPNESYEVVICK
jgi:Icc-related predicted phosphoesterase